MSTPIIADAPPDSDPLSPISGLAVIERPILLPADLRRSAHDYNSRGWSVHPLYGVNAHGVCQCPERTKCPSAGKHPRSRGWQNAPRMSAEDIDGHPGWSDTACRPEVARYSDGIGIRTGRLSRIIVLDEDIVGAVDAFAAEIGLDGGWPTTREHRSGSGGRHLFYAVPDDEPLPSSKRDGLDILGDGRQVVGAPSISGRGTYCVTADIAATLAPPELLAYVRRDRRPVPTQLPAGKTVASDDPQLVAYVEGAVRGELARLDHLARPWHEGAGWDDVTFKVCCGLLDLADSPWTALTREQVARLVHQHAPTDEAWGSAQVQAKLDSAVRTVTGQGRPFPDLAPRPRPFTPDLAVTTTTASEPERHPVVSTPTKPETSADNGATAVVNLVTSRWALHVTPGGEPFASPLSGPRLPVMLGERGGRLRDVVTNALFEETNRVPSSKAVDDAMRVVVAKARASRTVTPLHLRVAPHAGGLVLDLAQPGSGACVVITATGWEVLDNPPDGVQFRRTSASRPLPTPSRTGSLLPLRELLGRLADDPREDEATWCLLRGWLVAALRPDIARPTLGVFGKPGSGKSSRTRLLVSVIDPTEELGSSFGRNLDDDRVHALNRYLVSYDNLNTMSEQAQDHWCRLVSGESAEKRKNYSDGDLYSMVYRRTGAMTAVTMPTMRPDTLERVTPIHLERLTGTRRRGEADLNAAFAETHPTILGGLLDAAVTMLAGLPAARAACVERPRWADYYDTLAAYDPACARAYVASTVGAMRELAQDDPFIAAVQAWLAGRGGSYEGLMTPAWKAAARYAEAVEGLPIPGPWWPRSAARFSAEVMKSSEALRAVGITVHIQRKNTGAILTVTSEAIPEG